MDETWLLMLAVIAGALWLLLLIVGRTGDILSGSIRVLWWLTGVYPALVTITGSAWLTSSNRSSEAPPEQAEAGLFFFYQLAAGGLGALVIWGLLNSGRFNVRIALWLTVLLAPGITSSISIGDVQTALSLLLVWIIVAALAGAASPVHIIVRRLRLLFRGYAWASAAAILANPGYAIVTAEYNTRSFFGFDTRVVGVTGGSNILAVMMATLAILEYRGRKTMALWKLNFVVALGLLAWTQSRTGLGAAILGIAFLHVWQHHRRLGQTIRSGLPYATLALMFVPLILLTGGRSAQFNAFTTGRVDIWRVAWDTFSSSPLFGAGRNAIRGDGESGTIIGYIVYNNAHSQLLDAMAMFGILGGAGAAAFAVHVARETSSASNRTGGLSIGLYAVILTQLPFGTPLTAFGLSFNVFPLAIVLSVALSAHHNRPDEIEWGARQRRIPQGGRRPSSVRT